MKFKLIIFILLLSFLFCYSGLMAQEEPSNLAEEYSATDEFVPRENNFDPPVSSTTFNWYDPIVKLPEDFTVFGTRSFNKKNFTTLASLTFLTTLLVATDHESTLPLRQEYRRHETFHDVAKKITYLGDGEFHLGLAALFGGAGIIFKDNRAIRTALQIVEAEITTGLTVQVLKHISGRESPQSASAYGGKFRPLPNIAEYHKNQTKYYSFPSGHVSTSVAVLTVIAENYSQVKWIKPVGYSIVGLIGLGLAARGWHWLGDYPLAIAIGYTFGKIISDRNQSDPENELSEGGLALSPTYINGPGLSISYSF